MASWREFLSLLIVIVIATPTIEENRSKRLTPLSKISVPWFDISQPVNGTFSNVKQTKQIRRRRMFLGGCISQPEAPANGRIRCSKDSGCVASCKRDYKFPSGETQLAITCLEKQWNVVGTDWNFVPHCEPICLPACLNNGICVAPHTCNCPEKFTGPQCQFEMKPCLDFPPSVRNSQKRCNTKSCVVSCMENFTFPDGSSVTNLICKNGNWVPSRADWSLVPDCEPVCDPPCQNGGNCLPSNLCQCPQAYRGPQCQYSADACSEEKLGFNGGYSCTSTSNAFSCTLNCPAGIDFEFPPVVEYTCTYDKGVFEPQPIPRCKFEENMNVFPVGASYNSYVREYNHSWSIKDTFRSTIRDSSFESKFSNYLGTTSSSEMILANDTKNNMVLVEVVHPKPKTCITWGGVHYKTFDDNIISFDSGCAHTLLQETQNDMFTITVQNSLGCKQQGYCFRVIKLYVQGKEYSLSNNQAGVPEFRVAAKTLPIPAQLPGLRVETYAHFTVVKLNLVGIELKWDGDLMLQIDAPANLWNRTAGLCGNMNDDKKDDLIKKDGDHASSVAALASSWKTENIGESCEEYPDTRHACAANHEITKEASEFCTELLNDRRFQTCTDTLNFLSELWNACLWDYCACKNQDRRKCACDTMNVYIRQCAHKKRISTAGWRNNDTCPMECNNGRLYMSCGPRTESSCWTEGDKQSDTTNCEEGCFCPEGTVAHKGKCIYQEECPCRLRGELFEPGSSVQKDCNTCTCSSGKWICTQVRCSSRCSAMGDPHYTTFDGKHYDFMGSCKYYLMKGDSYSIEGENVPCLGGISQNLNFVPNDAPTCTKTVTINYNGTNVKLKQNRQVVINGEDVTILPVYSNDIRIRIASSIFLIVHLSNGLDIWWDGISRVYINAPPSFHGKTRGLCGTFTENQKDDFITPDGDVEQTAISFANKWKTDEHCVDLPEKEPKHPCDLNPQRRAAAKKYCSHLRSDIFSGCHWYVDPKIFYKNCLYDMCSCEIGVENCLCPTLAGYAKECAASGVKLSWRNEVEECRLHCPADQVYQICSNSCTRSCLDISMYQDCKQECVEGCNCPEGQTLNANGECIPIGQCPCMYSGQEFKPGYRHIRPGNKALELCTCSGGVWQCHEANDEELQKYPVVEDYRSSCLVSKNQEVTDCEPVEPRTCHNMHKPVTQMPTVCKPGCICASGYVLDAPNGTCIKQESCPCHHGGRSYKEGSVIQDECNTCECMNSKWKCTDHVCAGVCSAWGDSHYKTFDGRMYDFEGVCDYVLIKSSLSKEEFFDVSIQNVPCGTTGVTCSKSISLVVGSGDNQEQVTLTRGKELVDLGKTNIKRITMRKAGLFVFFDVPDIGLTLQWDKGTRVYVRLDPKWKGRTLGLCGDYNDNSEDDFKTPSGGIAEASANLFGDSWKKSEYCPEPKDVKDPCEQHPERKLFAVQKCGVLKSQIFSPCHTEVDVQPYLQNCIFDTCGCDSGGDCECLCTALAAYAQECNSRGVPIKWRSQELCPMQCDESCSTYSPCISTCPQETCDNLMTLKDRSHMCSQDACVEGCSIKSCPVDQVYRNDTYKECIPRENCKPFCMEIDGMSYYEGDTVSSDNCQTCFCSRGKVLCKGEPCTTTTQVAITVPHEEPRKCVEGWTAWINSDPEIKGKKYADIEPLPTFSILENIKGSAVCDKKHMVDIRCRSVKDHLTPKETGFDVECSLERGLYCEPQTNAPCIDFEISVLCQCSSSTTSIPETTIHIREECSLDELYSPHPTDCHLFYQCVPREDGTERIQNTCGPNMFYNPQTRVCDWPVNVMTLRPECSVKETTSTFTVNEVTNTSGSTVISSHQDIITQYVCKEDETWSNCAIRCNKMCHYYYTKLWQRGQCRDTSDCIPGCVPKKLLSCPPDKFWRDAATCVDMTDCSCISRDGNYVAPGAVIKESECEICQCIDNFYTCDRSSCFDTTTNVHTTTVEPFTPEEHTIVVFSTVSPPPDCDSKNYVPLIQRLRDQVSFNASSTRSSHFKPENSLLNGIATEESAGSWEPEYVDTNQWLDIKFPRPEPIYGVILQGSNLEDKFVTSYRILFSENGHVFSYVLDDEKQPRVFRGPVDRSRPVQQKLYEPIEAKVVRINPLTWHNGIAIRVELLGCQEYAESTTPTIVMTNIDRSTTPISIENIVQHVCKDPMGLDDGLMVPAQVSASSSLTDLLPSIKLSSPGAWHPKLDNPHQYVKFDFLEPRNLTGLVTRGGDDSWTTVYKVYYSNDDYYWNPIIHEDLSEVEFLGNFDSVTKKVNYFERPLQARYLKIQPTQWYRHVSLKAEVLGCFLPYPTVTTTTEEPKLSTTETSRTPECNVCEGVSSNYEGTCRCRDPYWWDGHSCVEKQRCPCVVGHITYNVGAVYETEDCRQCTCVLGGTSTCSPKKCEPCTDPEMQSVVTKLCNCICKPCSSGTRLCPTSNVCIDETAWCNGIQDCPDDEKNCTVATTPRNEFMETTTQKFTIQPTTPVIKNVCQDLICPPGYKVVLKESKAQTKSVKTRTKGAVKTKNIAKTSLRNMQHRHDTMLNDLSLVEVAQCLDFTCVPTKLLSANTERPEPSPPCPTASCPPDYTVVFEKMSKYKLQNCPKYTCKPPAVQEVVCNVTGRIFNTFDNLEYQYNICNHILARDMFTNKWYITAKEECNRENGICARVLVITMDDDVIVLYPDMHVDINEYSFTPQQLARLANTIFSFKISNIGDRTYFFANHYGFWVIWDKNSDVRIGVSTKLARRIDGLCGYFDGYSQNDRQMPDGSQARSTVEFGNSWVMEGALECESQDCPYEIRVQAWQICNTMKDQSFFECSRVVDVEKSVSRCVENVCTCLRGNQTYDDCRCRSLTNFITECQAGDLNVDLSSWRSAHDCPVSCPPPFVHKDCFRNKCETSCDNLQQVDPCPAMQGVCFPGCFCPEGTVRNGDECVPPTQCRDCTCEWFGNSKFITFDRQNLKFDGNCTHILSRDIKESIKGGREDHKYQVLVSNKNCASGICTEAVTVLYEGHNIQIKQSAQFDEFKVFMDGLKVDQLPHNTSWSIIEQVSPKAIKLLIPDIQLEITSFQPNFAFTLSLPSHVFGGAMEGLCGNCNNDSEDDLKKLDGQTTSDVEDFGASWLVTDVPQGVDIDTTSCTINHDRECVTSVTEQEVCKGLLDAFKFGQCHNLVDPSPYLTACLDTVCTGGNYCDSFEGYARKCQQMDVCLTWRTPEFCPYNCPSHLEYRPCASTCEKTCDTIIDDRNAKKCSLNPTEGCYCPHEQVLHNDTCIPREKCFVCDEEGHLEGDTWYPDTCTKCTCSKNVVNCERTECRAVDVICEENMIPTMIEETKFDCCPKYHCVPKSVTTMPPVCVEDTKKPECGFGQIMKVSTDENGCKKFICECLPPSECPVIDEVTLEVEEMQPGYVRQVNTSGCCSHYDYVCDPDKCPVPNCPDYYKLTSQVNPGICCPLYKCERLTGICLRAISSNDSETKKDEIIAKNIGEEWMENKCTVCTCNYIGTSPEVTCSSKTCTDAEQHPDISDFVLEEILLEDECCPKLTRTACKHGNQVYNVGESWYPNPEDICSMMECIMDDNVVQKRTLIQECNRDCDIGYEYQPSSDKSTECCGRCIPTACVVDQELKNIGDEWYSEDYCTKFSCESINGTIQVQSVIEKCPKIDTSEIDEFETGEEYIPGQCCPVITKTGCFYNGTTYKPGEKWKHVDDPCVTEICVLQGNVTKQKEIETCPKDCLPGWVYEESKGSECCGKCKQVFCAVGDELYERGATWSSSDNCTMFTCADEKGQLAIISTYETCPSTIDCPAELIYTDGCCKRCNLTSANIKMQTCAADVLEAQNTVGMFVINHPDYGLCKNLRPVQGITECRGRCESSTYFDTGNWDQVVDCQCCTPTEYVTRIIELTCQGDISLTKAMRVPVSCSCQACNSNKYSTKGGRKT